MSADTHMGESDSDWVIGAEEVHHHSPDDLERLAGALDGTQPSYWQTREGRIEQAIRVGLREAGVRGPLYDLVGPILRQVLAVEAEEK